MQRLSSGAEHCEWDEIDDLAQDVTSICCTLMASFTADARFDMASTFAFTASAVSSASSGVRNCIMNSSSINIKRRSGEIALKIRAEGTKGSSQPCMDTQKL